MSGPADSTSSWFRKYRRVPVPARRLLVFPHAGGSASVFRSWPNHLPPDIEMLAVQYPGRQDRLHEPCLDRMEEMADAISAAALSLRGTPIALFGHSMGASIAHEVALRLERRHGLVADTLLVSARLPPRYHRSRDPRADDEALLADVRRLDGRGAAVLDDPDMRELVLPAIRADYRLADTYVASPGQTVTAPVVAYVGDRDPDVRVSQMRAWSEVTAAGFVVGVFPGDHFYLFGQEAELVGDIVRRLGAVQA